MQKKVPLFHPFLFACYPIFYFYDQNKYEVWFQNVITPLAFSLLVAIILFLFFFLLVKEKHKAGLCAVFCLILFFSYTSFIQQLSRSSAGLWILNADPNLYVSYLILIFTVLILIKKSQSDFSKLSSILNFFSLILLSFPIYSLINFELTISKVSGNLRIKKEQIILPELKNKKKPDIYYIILDSYPREDIVKDFYGFNNSDFIQFLKGEGFYIGNKSRSNYPATGTSLSSSLNMGFVTTHNAKMESHKSDSWPLFEDIENNRVTELLKSQGYKYIHFTSDISVTDFNKNADSVMTSPFWFPAFTVGFANSTILKKLNLNIFNSVKIRQKTILYAFDKLKEIPDDRAPTFTFAHLMIPHWPLVFDRNGNTPKGSEGQGLDGYIEFLRFANKKAESLIQDLIAQSEIEPIIILQGDHGSEHLGLCIEPDELLLKEKLAILNAYLVPEEIKEGLYESISPVNTFRVIFNRYFGANLKLLEDKSLFTYCGYSVYQPVKVPDEKYLPTTPKKFRGNEKWIASLEETISKYPDNVYVRNTLGKEYFRVHAFEKAEKHLRIALKLKNNSLANLIYLNMGKALRAQNKNMEAIQSFQNALSFNPESIDMNLFLADALVAGKEYEKAKFYLTKVTSSSSLPEKGYRWLGRLYSEMGDVEKEIEQYKKIIRYHGHYPEIHMKLGIAYDQLKTGRNAILHTKIAGQLYSDEDKGNEASKMATKFRDLINKYNYSANDFAGVRIARPKKKLTD
jgi:tetratricopeptide (TPR) repeat protein